VSCIGLDIRPFPSVLGLCLIRQLFTYQLLGLIHLRRLPLLSTLPHHCRITSSSDPALTSLNNLRLKESRSLSLEREDDEGGKGRRPVGDRVPYIPRAMTRRVDRERSILGTELEEPK
jgi:hypothetical protein